MYESNHQKTSNECEMILNKEIVNDNRLNPKHNKNVNGYESKIGTLTNCNEAKKRSSNIMHSSFMTSASYGTLG